METNIVFKIDGCDVYCIGHPELEKRVGFTIGEGMAMFGTSWGPLYIVNLETGEVKQLIDENKHVVGFTEEDFDFAKLKKIEHRRCLDNMIVDYGGLHRYSDYRNGVCCIYWMLYPDGQYFADDGGFGMEDNDEEDIYCFIDKHFNVLVPFQPMTDKERRHYELEAQMRCVVNEH